ncbi:tRNA (N6-threonylcarbamoyladenosine(37)-N6)-methyltransferase TrmO [Desulfolucanica intricata]|uniref:tRNA (N6-threonylcarbamoyladenosine(37)-N6)-methyltransferase TrmO n=1 Tax=Desulfolucanica intricata TaxID=1285191 RepID=UPI00083297CA|nr:tRNA (N6-threonylcarbamoyladenosine(37)-N6)-methyltransferase TrmO [Desulfolucanica intricata]
MVTYTLNPIGKVRTEFKERSQAPNQGRFSDRTAYLELDPQYLAGLKDIETVSHLIVLYWGHLSDRQTLVAKPPFGDEPRGVFASRSPNRPNPVALCVAELLEVNGNVLKVRGLDALDQSPLIDIKPYSTKVDGVSDAHIGWLEAVQAPIKKER